ncbi:hypothetical protein C162_30944 [Paenibacillus sp. FSL R7-269]|uniref:hypothetical protein n=1 Tax=Paenibacillus sp. FSL R7-269 TaxID=1226755 RepID=UPI0003E1D873|nr:hypothetical protein [Paenibacillus sp. FSL R7-269]ETT32905.1 hypothetical protein C162_30944 [Paenibacillus sp. FSL R7-269]
MKQKNLIYALMLALILSVVSGAGNISAAARNITDIVKVTKPTEIKIGELKSFQIAITDWTDGDVADYDFTPISSDENIVKVVRKTQWVSELHALNKGTATLTVNIGEKFEPYVFNVQVVDDYTVIPEPTPTPTPEPTNPVVIKEPTHEEIMIKDVEEYSKQLELLENYEEKAITTYNQLIDLRIKDSTRKTFFLSLSNTVVPNYTKFVSGLKYVKVNNAELKEIHNHYLAGAKLQLEGMTIMRDSLKTTKINYPKFEAGYNKVGEGVKQLDKAELLLDNYIRKYIK